MNILHLSTFDQHGGAFRAAYRLHKSLNGIGIHSKMLVQRKFSDDPTVNGPSGWLAGARSLWLGAMDRLPLLLYPGSQKRAWAVGWFKSSISSRVREACPDLVHLQWICRGFVPIKVLAEIRSPLVWTLHDSWAFTGGCHVPGDCLHYRKSCGCCPHLASGKEFDVSRWVWKQKRKYWESANLTVVAPSKWLAQCAKASSLFRDRRVEIIPNSLDTTVFRPVDSNIARLQNRVPPNKAIILVGAAKTLRDKNKGFHLLRPALQRLAANGWAQKAELVVFGEPEPKHPPAVGLKATYVGYVDDDLQLALLYSAAAVFVCPSVQEAFGLTVLEALACATPVVAFNVSGIPDMVEHKKNGYLARPFDTDDLANGIAWVLKDHNRAQLLSARAREKVEQEFALERVARRYASLYRDILTHGTFRI